MLEGHINAKWLHILRVISDSLSVDLVSMIAFCLPSEHDYVAATGLSSLNKCGSKRFTDKT